MATPLEDQTTARPVTTGAPLRAPGILIGIGMGGFVDGIVLHQLLQWHQMLSTTEGFDARTLEDVQANVVADGVFHVATWFAVAVGVGLLWRVAGRGLGRRSWRSLLGWALVGWGLFNLVEGVIDHHILGVHRVRPAAADPLVYDVGFLVLGAVLVLIGLVVQRSDVGRMTSSRQPM